MDGNENKDGEAKQELTRELERRLDQFASDRGGWMAIGKQGARGFLEGLPVIGPVLARVVFEAPETAGSASQLARIEKALRQQATPAATTYELAAEIVETLEHNNVSLRAILVMLGQLRPDIETICADITHVRNALDRIEVCLVAGAPADETRRLAWHHLATLQEVLTKVPSLYPTKPYATRDPEAEAYILRTLDYIVSTAETSRSPLIHAFGPQSTPHIDDMVNMIVEGADHHRQGQLAFRSGGLMDLYEKWRGTPLRKDLYFLIQVWLAMCVIAVHLLMRTLEPA